VNTSVREISSNRGYDKRIVAQIIGRTIGLGNGPADRRTPLQ
jgi:hypothetical protein